MTAPILIVGLGNPLMGDEGAGWHLVQRLQSDSRRPAQAEVTFGGTDLLALAGRLEGRRAVILTDAALDPNHPGRLTIHDNDFSALSTDQGHAHHLSLVQSIELLRTLNPTLASTRFVLLTIGVAAAQFAGELSPEVHAALPRAVGEILRLAETL
ncbi:MAG: hydrogenase maturation protease [Candidatus Zixiibacteriota bacterium]|nr:MAG: hydrogenase maturation protease [candidate division Zixibacteria bacterium]